MQQVAGPLASKQGIVRACKQCGAADHELPGPEGDPCRHFVQIELRYRDRADDPTDVVHAAKMKRQGWREIMVMGRKAFERFMCMTCLNSNEIARGLHAEYQRDARKLEKREGEQNFYLILCDE